MRYLRPLCQGWEAAGAGTLRAEGGGGRASSGGRQDVDAASGDADAQTAAGASNKQAFHERNAIDREGAMRRWLLTRENAYALILCLIVIAVIVMTADQSPQWLYQGF